MYKEEIYLPAKDQVKLYTQLWLPQGHQKAGIILIHGIGDYCERYENITKYFVENNFVVFMFDLRGHGKSEGKRGYIKEYSTLLNDIDIIVKEFVKRNPDIPLFLYGQGVGGSLALNYCINYNKYIRGAIVASPWMKLIKNSNHLKLKLVYFLARIFPSCHVNLNINSDYLSHNIEIVKQYQTDPLILKKVTLSFFAETHKGCLSVLSNRYKINVPVLLMHGRKDKISLYKSSKAFASNTKNFTAKIWNGMYHELHNEPENKEIFDFVKEWILTIIW